MKALCSVAFVVAWLLLAATASAKAISLGSTAQIMERHDPILGLRVRTVVILATAVEVCACIGLLLLKDNYLRVLVLGGLGAEFLAYHGMKQAISPDGPCPCWGSSWRWLGLTAALAVHCG